MNLSAANLETLRSRPQSTKLYLSIFEPQIVMKCRVNNPSAGKGDRLITYDGVTLGSHNAVEDNYTMWVGTTDGAQDLGKIRIKNAGPSQFAVSENSNIDWQNDAYLTIFKYVELWPIFPRIISNPADVADSIFYKDFNIEYSNQNSILGTFVNAGPHRAANLDPASGQAQIYYSSTGTFNLRGTNLNCYWTFEGGSPSSSTAVTPGYVTYDTPGHYVTKLSVSGTNGASDVTYRYVSIYNESSPPLNGVQWQLISLNGSRDEGGYRASFRVFGNVEIQENSVVVLFQESFYGNTRVSFGGNHPNNSDIFWVGYVTKDSIEYDYQHSQVSFEAYSITGMMKESSGFSVSVESKASPNRWYELLDMDCRRAI
jgi:hypothetical protein